MRQEAARAPAQGSAPSAPRLTAPPAAAWASRPGSQTGLVPATSRLHLCQLRAIPRQDRGEQGGATGRAQEAPAPAWASRHTGGMFLPLPRPPSACRLASAKLGVLWGRSERGPQETPPPGLPGFGFLLCIQGSWRGSGMCTHGNLGATWGAHLPWAAPAPCLTPDLSTHWGVATSYGSQA